MRTVLASFLKHLINLALALYHWDRSNVCKKFQALAQITLPQASSLIFLVICVAQPGSRFPQAPIVSERSLQCACRVQSAQEQTKLWRRLFLRFPAVPASAPEWLQDPIRQNPRTRPKTTRKPVRVYPYPASSRLSSTVLLSYVPIIASIRTSPHHAFLSAVFDNQDLHICCSAPRFNMGHSQMCAVCCCPAHQGM